MLYMCSLSSAIQAPLLHLPWHFFCLQWGLLKLHSWFLFEVGPLCVLICGSIARYVVDSLFYSLWLHLFCVVLSVSLPLLVWRPHHSLRGRHVRRTLARTLAPMVVHQLIVMMDNIGRYVHHIFFLVVSKKTLDITNVQLSAFLVEPSQCLIRWSILTAVMPNTNHKISHYLYSYLFYIKK